MRALEWGLAGLELGEKLLALGMLEHIAEHDGRSTRLGIEQPDDARGLGEAGSPSRAQLGEKFDQQLRVSQRNTQDVRDRGDADLLGGRNVGRGARRDHAPSPVLQAVPVHRKQLPVERRELDF